jgi:hypothetical protein
MERAGRKALATQGELNRSVTDCVYLILNVPRCHQDIHRALTQLVDDLRGRATENRRAKPNPPPRYPYKDGRAYKAMLRRYGINVPLNGLWEIAEQVAQITRSHVDRESKRRKDLLYEWLDEHYEGLRRRCQTSASGTATIMRSSRGKQEVCRRPGRRHLVLHPKEKPQARMDSRHSGFARRSAFNSRDWQKNDRSSVKSH